LSTISVLFVPLLRHAIADDDAVESDTGDSYSVLCFVVLFMMMMMLAALSRRTNESTALGRCIILLHGSYACISR
jgi:hypothetical protein